MSLTANLKALRPSVEDRRCKLVRIQPRIIVMMLQEGNWLRVVQNGLPADAEVQAVNYEPSMDCFLVRVWSSEFEPVGDGHCIPMAEDALFETERKPL